MKILLDSGAETSAVNVALTVTGLEMLGVPKEERSQFSVEFLEGMAPERVGGPDAPFPRRCNILGDVGENSPQHWHWGGWNANRKIDGLLLLYAPNEDALERLVNFEMEQMCGIEFLEPVSGNQKDGALILVGRLPDDGTEHFGFKDGDLSADHRRDF